MPIRRRARASRDEAPPEFTGYIIFYVRPEDAGEIKQILSADAAETLDGILGGYDLSLDHVGPLVTSVSREQVTKLEAEARESLLPPLRSVNQYMRLDARHQSGDPQELVDRLTDEHFDAYREKRVGSPQVGKGWNPLQPEQIYLKHAPLGIAAEWMWTQCHGDGKGVAVIDLEEAWNLDHEDLVANRPWLIYGDNLHDFVPNAGHHGTSVLGVLMAEHNGVGVVGIAPGAARVGVASHFRAPDDHEHVVDAILKATTLLRPGDVLLLEVEIKGEGLPVETEPAQFAAIRTATGSGRIVVAAAGNGRKNLDDYMAGMSDSGAILVGAATGTHPYRRSVTNFGKRINCFAHGEGVVTCTNQTGSGPNPNNDYTKSFDGTSAAAAIIAGAVILVQGRYKGLNGKPLLPVEMRDILSNPDTGTLTESKGDLIGVMPNLWLITGMSSELGGPR